MTTKQKLTLILLLGSQFMLSIDFSILNVALPAIRDGLHLGPGALPWVATAFALPSAGFTLLFGRLGDLAGRRRLFFGGLALLAAGSLAGGLSPAGWVLLTARFAQGTAAAIAIPSALALLTTAFPEGPMRERALGLNGALLAGGFTVGALLGGVLSRVGLWLVLGALAIAFFGHVTGIVSYTVTATSGLPDDEQGLATGLTTMTQLVGLTVGIPVLSAIAGTMSIGGVRRGVAADVALNVLVAVIVWAGLRVRTPLADMPVSCTAEPRGAAEPVLNK
jgi:MFS family permease